MSSMKAVLFVPDNYPHVINEMNLPTFERLVRTKRSEHKKTANFYFIPSYVNADGDITSWIAMQEDRFRAMFDYDDKLIQTQFVPITRK